MLPRVGIPLAFDLHRLSQTEFKRFPAGSALGPIVPPPDSACGVLSGALAGKFTINSRVGPFFLGLTGKVFGIFRDPNNTHRLIAVASADYGETWALADDTFPVLTNLIASHDAELQSGLIIVGVQEAVTGRTSYSAFDASTGLWSVQNEQIVATSPLANSPIPGEAAVSICQRSSGQIAVAYMSSEVTITKGTPPRFETRFRLSPGVWSAPLHTGDWGDVEDSHLNRLIALDDDEIRVTWTFNFSIVGSPLKNQIVSAANTLGPQATYKLYGALGGPVYAVGQYVVYHDGGQKTAIPISNPDITHNARIAFFTGNSPTVDFVASVANSPDITGGGGTENPSMGFFWVGGKLVAMALSLSLALDTNIWFKTGGPSAFAPDNSDLRFGPMLPPSPGNTQEQNTAAFEFGTVTYIASFWNEGTHILYNLTRIDLLPSAAETVAQFIARCTH
jgi:hypothetical protein